MVEKDKSVGATPSANYVDLIVIAARWASPAPFGQRTPAGEASRRHVDCLFHDQPDWHRPYEWGSAHRFVYFL